MKMYMMSIRALDSMGKEGYVLRIPNKKTDPQPLHYRQEIHPSRKLEVVLVPRMNGRAVHSLRYDHKCPKDQVRHMKGSSNSFPFNDSVLAMKIFDKHHLAKKKESKSLLFVELCEKQRHAYVAVSSHEMTK